MKPYCGGCRFFDRDTPNKTFKNPPAGECRRHAPRPVISDDPTGKNASFIDFPRVGTAHWCGEFKEANR